MRRNDELAAALRFLDGGRMGFAYTSNFSDETLEQIIAQASAGAKLTDPQPELTLPAPPAGPWATVDVYDPELSTIPLEEKIDRVRAMEASALSRDPRVEKVRQAEYREADFSIWLANHHGLSYQHSGTVVSGNLMVKAVEGGDAEMGYEFDFARHYRKLDLEKVGRAAADRALACLGGRKIATGRRPVILENGWWPNFSRF